jgi:phenylalanyl-tRNA synthetase alpha chain
MSALVDLPSLRAEFQEELDKASSAADLELLRVRWLGRKEGRVTDLLKQLGALSIDDKKKYGPLYQQLKADLESALDARNSSLKQAERLKGLESDKTDISLPGVPYPLGHLHPLGQVMNSLVSIFRSLGFVCADGPEMESEFFNFEGLNIPENHPARDMQDTFYLANYNKQLSLPQIHDAPSQSEPVLLRTHTSPVQVRVMQKYPPPIAIVVPGRVYRNEAQDATHSSTFHQMEGLLVDEKISFADLKGTLSRFAQLFFAPTVKTRFKPSYFPFTEPSAQMDVSCYLCDGAGCRTCKQSGWIELLGAGMVNPKVLSRVNIDAEKYSGFAFGMGVERLAMIKFGIDDMRLFYENDLRFLRQF